MLGKMKTNARLSPEVNRIIFVRNLPHKISPEELYDIFGKYGAIRQIRKGSVGKTKGTAFVIYHDIFEAKNVAFFGSRCVTGNGVGICFRTGDATVFG